MLSECMRLLFCKMGAAYTLFWGGDTGYKSKQMIQMTKKYETVTKNVKILQKITEQEKGIAK